MHSDALQDRSERLASLVNGISAALHASAVPEDAASRLLANASAAVLDALTLDLMLADDSPKSAAAPVERSEARPVLPLAA